MMRRTRIKFCGMTRQVDVDAAVALGVDAIGLILAERSPRRLDIPAARALRAGLPPLVTAVALVMDAPLTQLREILSVVRPQLIQFHGEESDADCRAAGCAYLKVVGMGGGTDAAAAMARHPGAAGFVLDGHAPGQPGGSGLKFDWSDWPAVAPRPLVLAGGLTPDNVFEAVRRLRPFAVDVSSGIESAPGIKCPERMARFVEAVRAADAAS